MAFFNKADIYAALTSEELCHALGIPVKHMRGKKYIINPCRSDDNKEGSCSLNYKGCYDFATRRQYNYESMVMGVLQCSYKDALKYLAELTHISPEADIRVDLPPLSIPELKSLGFRPQGCVLDIKSGSDHRKTVQDRRDGTGVYLVGKEVSFSFKQLWKEDKILYYTIISNRCKEMIATIEKQLAFYETLAGAIFLAETGLLSERFEFSDALRQEKEYLISLWKKTYTAVKNVA